LGKRRFNPITCRTLVACLAFGLTATMVEQQPEHLRWTAEARGRLAVVAAVT
jgi:hypothetical protein